MAASTRFQSYKASPVPSSSLPKNERIVGQFGCNGVYHVAAFTRLTLDDKGNIVSGVEDGFEQLGLCDGSCANSTAPLGDGFTYEYDAAKEHRDE